MQRRNDVENSALNETCLLHASPVKDEAQRLQDPEFNEIGGASIALSGLFCHAGH